MAEFRTMGDGTGESRALNTMIRSLVVLGRVNEALASLRQAASLAGHISETMVHQVDAMAVSVAAQIGDPELAPEGDVAGAPLEGASFGWTEVASQQGLITLQRGNVAAALEQLESANRAVPGPYGPHRRAFSGSSVALAYAATTAIYTACPTRTATSYWCARCSNATPTCGRPANDPEDGVRVATATVDGPAEHVLHHRPGVRPGPGRGRRDR